MAECYVRLKVKSVIKLSAHSAGVYHGFFSMKWLEVSPLPPFGWDTSQHFIKLLRQFASTHLYYWVKERGVVKEKWFAQEHNTMTWPGLETRPLNPYSSALTITWPCLLGFYTKFVLLLTHHCHNSFLINYYFISQSFLEIPLYHNEKLAHLFLVAGSWEDQGRRCTIFVHNGAITGWRMFSYLKFYKQTLNPITAECV